MSNTTLNDQIKELHAAYVAESHLEVVLTMHAMFAWEAWMARGWTRVDLELTIRFIHRWRRNRPTSYPPSLSFRKLIQDQEYFEDYLSQAKAEMKRYVPPPTPKQQAVEQFRGPQRQDDQPAKPIKDVIKESAALADLRQWKLKTFGTEL